MTHIGFAPHPVIGRDEAAGDVRLAGWQRATPEEVASWEAAAEEVPVSAYAILCNEVVWDNVSDLIEFFCHGDVKRDEFIAIPKPPADDNYGERVATARKILRDLAAERERETQEAIAAYYRDKRGLEPASS